MGCNAITCEAEEMMGIAPTIRMGSDNDASGLGEKESDLKEVEYSFNMTLS
jgi:hypothetical protein